MVQVTVGFNKSQNTSEINQHPLYRTLKCYLKAIKYHIKLTDNVKNISSTEDKSFPYSSR